MPDYVGILKRSISSLPESDPAVRRAVYERARSALARQLTGIDPPLSADEIEVQHQHLEDAIREVEGEFAAVDEAEPPPPAEPPHAGLAPAAEPPPPEPVDRAPHAPAHVPPAAPIPEPIARASVPREPPPPAQDETAVPPVVEDKPARRSLAPMMVVLAVIALMAVGAAALGYTQWETVQTVYGDLRDQFLGSDSAEVAAVTDTPTVVEAPEAPGGPADEPAAQAPAEALRAAPDKSEDRLIAGPGAEGQDQAALEPPAAAAPPGAGPAEPEIPAFDRPPPPPDQATPGQGAGLVAQRAIFYQQGEEGSAGTAIQGAVSWERVERPGEPPAIEANIDLPEQDAEVTLTFTSNADPALPASHLIEIAMEGDLGSGAIQRVPALVLKPSEQARGQALAGAAVPVTERLFWIALSDDPDQIERNLSLLRDGSWFDMPIMYENGERALLTFEKGIPGDRVFETVLAEWAEAQQSQR